MKDSRKAAISKTNTDAEKVAKASSMTAMSCFPLINPIDKIPPAMPARKYAKISGIACNEIERNALTFETTRDSVPLAMPAAKTESIEAFHASMKIAPVPKKNDMRKAIVVTRRLLKSIDINPPG